MRLARPLQAHVQALEERVTYLEGTVEGMQRRLERLQRAVAEAHKGEVEPGWGPTQRFLASTSPVTVYSTPGRVVPRRGLPVEVG